MKEIKYRTEVNPEPSDWKIDLSSRILTIGSCFADVLGGQLEEYKFEVLNNVLGTVFNPVAICKIVDAAMEGKVPNPNLYFQNDDQIFLHHDFHSSQWAKSQPELEQQLLQKQKEIATFLKTANVLVITLGTAYAYRHKSTNTIIGNCHKLPADRFVKELLHVDQMNVVLEQLVQKLLVYNRSLRIVLTVSPVRHVKDTIPLNQVSKSLLRLLCHRITEKYKPVSYFPSYEIMVDELRDYRFYEEDLIHPNATAEKVIFNAFVKTYLTPDAIQFIDQWEYIARAFQHKPHHGNTKSYLHFLKATREKLRELSAQKDVSAELEEIEARIREFRA